MDEASYVEWAPDAAARPYVACTWAARFAASGAPHVERVLPDGCIDLIWVAGALVIAGPDRSSVDLTPMPGARFAG